MAVIVLIKSHAIPNKRSNTTFSHFFGDAMSYIHRCEPPGLRTENLTEAIHCPPKMPCQILGYLRRLSTSRICLDDRYSFLQDAL